MLENSSPTRRCTQRPGINCCARDTMRDTPNSPTNLVSAGPACPPRPSPPTEKPPRAPPNSAAARRRRTPARARAGAPTAQRPLVCQQQQVRPSRLATSALSPGARAPSVPSFPGPFLQVEPFLSSSRRGASHLGLRVCGGRARGGRLPASHNRPPPLTPPPLTPPIPPF